MGQKIIILPITLLFIMMGCRSKENKFIGTWCETVNEVAFGCKVEVTTIWQINSDNTLKEITIRKRLTKSKDKSGGYLVNPNLWLGPGIMQSEENVNWSVKSNKFYINDSYISILSITKDSFVLKGGSKKLVFTRCNHKKHHEVLLISQQEN